VSARSRRKYTKGQGEDGGEGHGRGVEAQRHNQRKMGCQGELGSIAWAKGLYFVLPNGASRLPTRLSLRSWPESEVPEKCVLSNFNPRNRSATGQLTETQTFSSSSRHDKRNTAKRGRWATTKAPVVSTVALIPDPPI
jgi:hypothetical protein